MASVAIVPLFLLVPLIAKHQNISNTPKKRGSNLRVEFNSQFRQPITNHHSRALQLPVESIKKEIASLYNAADKVKVGNLSLRDVFKLDGYTLDANGIEYKKLLPKI